MSTTTETVGATTERHVPERVRCEFLLEAQTPVAHHSENIGNEAIFMRQKVRRRGGWEYVPYITSGAMRNRMRKAATMALLEAAGLRANAFSEDALRLLFNGGTLRKGDGGSAFRIDLYRELCELVPPLALFGGCAGGQINESRLITEDALLVCRETEHYVERWIADAASERWGALETSSSHIDSVMRVRSDATRDPELQRLLTDGAVVEMNRRLLARAKADDDDDDVEKAKEKGGLMPRTMELVAKGSLFQWSCEATVASPLERDTFDVAVIAFLSDARVGGKQKSEGCGHLKVVAANRVKIGERLRECEKMNMQALAPAVGQLFRAHVTERRERIASFLEKVVA